MLDHPISIVGWLLAAIGFFLLFAWVPTSVSAPGFGMRLDPVFNMHKAMISMAIMATGLVMAIVGTLARGFESLQKGRAQELSSAAHPSAKRSVAADQIKDGDFSQTNWVITVKDRQGRDRELRVSNDGSATLDTITGPKIFDSVDAAAAYLK